MNVTQEAFASTLSAEDIRVARIIVAAIVLGAVLFLGVAALVPRTTGGETGNDSQVRILSFACLALAAGGLSAALFVPRLLLHTTARKATTGKEVVAAFRAATIVRIALTEGGALLGCVVLLIAGPGLLAVKPIYWINALPVVAHVFMGFAFWPSRDAWLLTFRELR